MSKNASSQKGFSRFKGKVKMVIMDTILCGKGVLLAVVITKYLMEEHGLKQGDLTDIGSQGVVSEILNGKRELNVRQIKALSIRFNVSPAVFL